MGRAQVVQAEAAGIMPVVDMNPILLKPTTDVGSQVIVHGLPIGHMKAREYFGYKKELIPKVLESYQRLDQEYDIIVIEGAGSPAEINLKSEDIVNMGMAKMAGAPVLLVGDIDRGGVFAQLYGTVMLLEEQERAMVKGLIINKFRGDKTILDPGLKMIEELCRLPVAGVVPYMLVDIEDEDSLSSRLTENTLKGLADIAVIRLPRMSNFTDFHVFSGIPHLSLRYVNRADQLGQPDLLILPGTKNTISDLLWLRQSGIEAAILKMAARDIPVIGICGGYQMMGIDLTDGEGIEGEECRSVRGMNLLPLHTVYEPVKTTTRVRGRFSGIGGILAPLSDMEVEGYEIHMGVTKADSCAYMADIAEYQQGGLSGIKEDGAQKGNLYGTYLHGIFDGPGVAAALAAALMEKNGFNQQDMETIDLHTYKERQYEELARLLRNSLDMDQIYRIIEQGIGKDEYDRKDNT